MPSPREPSNSDLFFHAVREIAGDEGVAAVQAHRGGTDVTVPRFIARDHWLSRALGFEQAGAVCAKLRVIDGDGRLASGMRFLCPLGDASVLRKTSATLRAKAEALLLSGASRHEVSRETGVSIRTVAHWKAALVSAGKLPRNAPLRRRP